MRVGSDRWEGIVSTFARADSRDNVHMSYLANTANPNGVRFTPGETMSITDVSMPNKYAHNYIRLVVRSRCEQWRKTRPRCRPPRGYQPPCDVQLTEVGSERRGRV